MSTHIIKFVNFCIYFIIWKISKLQTSTFFMKYILIIYNTFVTFRINFFIIIMDLYETKRFLQAEFFLGSLQIFPNYFLADQKLDLFYLKLDPSTAQVDV